MEAWSRHFRPMTVIKVFASKTFVDSDWDSRNHTASDRPVWTCECPAKVWACAWSTEAWSWPVHLVRWTFFCACLSTPCVLDKSWVTKLGAWTSAVSTAEPRSSSVHRRHLFGPEGDLGNQRVRMSNLLVHNLACFLELLGKYRKVWFVIEQPTSSWLFKMNAMLMLMALASCKRVHTWKLDRFACSFLISCFLCFHMFPCCLGWCITNHHYTSLYPIGPMQVHLHTKGLCCLIWQCWIWCVDGILVGNGQGPGAL